MSERSEFRSRREGRLGNGVKNLNGSDTISEKPLREPGERVKNASRNRETPEASLAKIPKTFASGFKTPIYL